MGEYLDRVLAAASTRRRRPGELRLAAGEPHPVEHMIAQSAHHIGGHDPQAHSVIEHHLRRAGAAAAGGDHTTAEMHFRDASRKIGAQLGHDHPLYHAASAAAEHHRQMFHSQHHMGAPVQHADYDAFHAHSAGRQFYEMHRDLHR